MDENQKHLIQLAHTKMPFGKYEGWYLIDIPEYYIVWYSNKGFPKGELGEQLKLIYELKLNKVISNLKVKFEVNNLTAFSEVDYDRIYMKYSVNNGGTWVDNNSNTILHFVNTDKITTT